MSVVSMNTHYYMSLFLDRNEFELYTTGDNRPTTLYITSDDLTLEYDDTVVLKFNPRSSDYVMWIESQRDFIRGTATVNIIDDDSKYSH